ncbi:MAG: metallophosphoesterase [Chloroflexi bacterium]|nr:metallophosphoesterase [Chloroflexota bacterium]
MRLYFCSDIHASERCWRKFLAAGTFYKADVIIVGGDITGKFVVPIIRHLRGPATATFQGIERRAETTAEIERLLRQIADAGQYGTVMSEEEYEAHTADAALRDRLFHQLIMARVTDWIEFAEARLRGSGIRCLVSGANDDFFEIDAALAASSVIEDPNGRVIDLGGIEIVGMGYGNPTPWPCPRDISEEELGERIDTAVTGVRRMDRAIFSFHVPPHHSGLDNAPRLDANLRMVMSGAGPEIVPVGSTAVRAAIERYEPMLGLHGHIHESKGVRTIGPTTVANPGSEYGEGILDGLLVDVDVAMGSPKVQLVTG